MSSKFRLGLMFAALGAVCLGVGCGDSDSGVPATGQSQVSFVNGTVAKGAAISNATVTLKDSLGNVATATTSSLGFYQINGNSGQFTPPYVFEMSGGIFGGLPNTQTLHSASSQNGNVNITPLTELIFASLFRVSNTQALFSGLTQSQLSTVTAANLAAIQTAVRNSIETGLINGQPIQGLTAFQTSQFADFLYTAFTANGTGPDAVLDSFNRFVTNLVNALAAFANANFPLPSGGTTGGGTTGGSTTGGSGNVSRAIAGGTVGITVTPGQGFNGNSAPLQEGTIVGRYVVSNGNGALTLTVGVPGSLPATGQRRQVSLSFNSEGALPVASAVTFPTSLSATTSAGVEYSFAQAAPTNQAFGWFSNTNFSQGTVTVATLNDVGVNVTFNFQELEPVFSSGSFTPTGRCTVAGTIQGLFTP